MRSHVDLDIIHRLCLSLPLNDGQFADVHRQLVVLGRVEVVELVYSVEFKARVDELGFMGELRKITGDGKVALLTGQESIDV